VEFILKFMAKSSEISFSSKVSSENERSLIESVKFRASHMQLYFYDVTLRIGLELT
jgi:hypothetical protein